MELRSERIEVGDAATDSPDEADRPPDNAPVEVDRQPDNAPVEVDRRLEARLRAGGHRVTSQRVLVYRALCQQDGHLTAEQVLDAVGRALPRISLPTIYATLELFEEIGLVRKLSAGAGALLFESRTTPHSHAVCRICGAVIDIEDPPIEAEAFARARDVGFAPDGAQLLVSGACQECRVAERSDGELWRARSIDSGITATSGNSSSVPQRMHSAS